MSLKPVIPYRCLKCEGTTVVLNPKDRPKPCGKGGCNWVKTST